MNEESFEVNFDKLCSLQSISPPKIYERPPWRGFVWIFNGKAFHMLLVLIVVEKISLKKQHKAGKFSETCSIGCDVKLHFLNQSVTNILETINFHNNLNRGIIDRTTPHHLLIENKTKKLSKQLVKLTSTANNKKERKKFLKYFCISKYKLSVTWFSPEARQKDSCDKGKLQWNFPIAFNLPRRKLFQLDFLILLATTSVGS